MKFKVSQEIGAHKKGQIARRLAPVVLVLIVLACAYGFGWFDYLSLSSIIRHREWLAGQVESHFAGALFGYVCLYAFLVAVSFPGASLVTVAAGLMFGGVVGGLATVLAATAGAVVIFLIAKSSIGDFLERRASGFVARLAEGFRRDSFNYLLSLRLTPLFPFWVVNIVPAMLNMRLGPYALATFIGIIPGTFAYAFIGASLGSVISAQEAANPGCSALGTCSIDARSLVTPQLLLAMAALGLVSLIPVVVRRMRAPRGAE